MLHACVREKGKKKIGLENKKFDPSGRKGIKLRVNQKGGRGHLRKVGETREAKEGDEHQPKTARGVQLMSYD